MRCPRCGFENANAVTFCAHCGTYLQTSTPYTQPQVDFPIPTPSPMEYSAPPSQSYGMQSELFSNQRIFPSRPRITVFRVIRSILYFIATFIAAFGLIGVFNGLFGTGNRAEGLAIFFALGLLVAGVVIFLIMRHRFPQLRLAHFIWGILGATVGWFMAVVLAYALGANPDLSLGLIFLLYGIVLAAASLW
jgi:hypothetical protein